MVQLEDLVEGSRITGVVPNQSVTVVAVRWHGADAVEVVYKDKAGFGERIVYRAEQDQLHAAPAAGRGFDAAAQDYKVVAEAQRIRLAGLSDPMLAVSTSDVQPLPHQIRAVYQELLPRTPLRFLLADDPGAGKTIMAGLYIKELMLRGDVERCLIVAPGGLVDQWQEELRLKFELSFEQLTNQLVDAEINQNVFTTHPRLIARMDQLARNEELQALLADSEWDLVVVDEAHRMGANYFGNELRKTKRFLLGEMMGQIARHLLLMTATPHAGKEENFQLFLTLLDRDRFEGRSTTAVNTDGIMRRMVKEDLLTFDGTPLFPHRVAETVPYELTAPEADLYERVSDYVRTGMNRADKLTGKRRNTVGFALTVLQRRLASSPEAIFQSLQRRHARLERRRVMVLNGTWTEQPELGVDPDDIDSDDYNAEELETLEEELLDSATAAQTVEELAAELAELKDLISTARQVRDSGTDRKWSELSTILQDHALTVDESGRQRKLIVFTEHRDTLDYLTGRIRSLIGRADAVQAIHGGVRRSERRRITEEFTKNPDCRILIATDAAGEGLNLQVAHLMVNYDLPWNPNRIEQRFGRIHRIGQTEVCRLWNLVADNTREGDVWTTLLAKIEEQRKAYGGKVFDVLGQAFNNTPLRTLLIEAIRYGDLPEVRAKMREIVNANVGEGLTEVIEDQALVSTPLLDSDVSAIKAAMDDARARRLQPHYIELAFTAAFGRFGGRLAKRETGRYEIANVPAVLRAASRAPIATKYERVTFDLNRIESVDRPRADLLAPGHPLHDTTMKVVVDNFGHVLDTGTTLVSSSHDQPHVLVGVVEEIVDGTGAAIAKRFGYAYVDEHGTVTPAGAAPYLDHVAAPETPAVVAARQWGWLENAERAATSWIVENQLPEHMGEVAPRRLQELTKTRDLVKTRLEKESERLVLDAAVAAEKEQRGEKVRHSSDSLTRRAADIDQRCVARLGLIEQQLVLSHKTPRIVTAALVLPLAMVEAELPDGAVSTTKETKEVERRGVDLVMATERALGREPVEQDFWNKGFDILSTDPVTGDTYRIEVKARIAGSKDFFVTHNEVICAKNAQPRYRLALVEVDPDGPDGDRVCYVADPFATTQLGDFQATGITGNWKKTWSQGTAPF